MHSAHIITLAGIAFYLDDPAHTALSGYLKSVETHFKDSPDREEIVADIEHRIAEYFSEQIKQPTEVISKKHVDGIVASLGKAEEFDDEKTAPDSSDPLPEKLLMRDSQNGIVAGVCSGLGAYFNVDPLLFRIAFVLFTFAGGSGILIYIVLWLVIPEARTSSDRLRMRGVPINVDTIAQQFRETGEKMGKEGRRAAKTISQRLSRTAPSLGTILARIIGTLITIIGAVSMAALTFGTTVLLVMKDKITGGTPFEAFPHTANEYLVVAVAFQVIALPILALMLSGISLSNGRRALGITGSIILWVLWFLAASVFCATVMNKHNEVRQELHAVEQKIQLEHPEWLDDAC